MKTTIVQDYLAIFIIIVVKIDNSNEWKTENIMILTAIIHELLILVVNYIH